MVNDKINTQEALNALFKVITYRADENKDLEDEWFTKLTQILGH